MAPGLEVAGLRASLPRREPVVLLNDDGGHDGHHSLRIDNRQGARLAVDHLLALGHRAVAFLAGPAGNSDAAERLLGYRDALTAGGLRLDPRLELPGDFTEESGFRSAARLARLPGPPTAVCAANDAMAIGCLAGLRERGLAVPADVSLVGFDDVPIARYLTPALTTVHVPIAELGRRAMRCVLDALVPGAAGEPLRAVIAPTLAIRASTAAPPAGGPSTTENQRRRRR
jgi:LacI family transcriptional regulator